MEDNPSERPEVLSEIGQLGAEVAYGLGETRRLLERLRAASLNAPAWAQSRLQATAAVGRQASDQMTKVAAALDGTVRRYRHLSDETDARRAPVEEVLSLLANVVGLREQVRSIMVDLATGHHLLDGLAPLQLPEPPGSSPLERGSSQDETYAPAIELDRLRHRVSELWSKLSSQLRKVRGDGESRQ